MYKYIDWYDGINSITAYKKRPYRYEIDATS